MRLFSCSYIGGLPQMSIVNAGSRALRSRSAPPDGTPERDLKPLPTLPQNGEPEVVWAATQGLCRAYQLESETPPEVSISLVRSINPIIMHQPADLPYTAASEEDDMFSSLGGLKRKREDPFEYLSGSETDPASVEDYTSNLLIPTTAAPVSRLHQRRGSTARQRSQSPIGSLCELSADSAVTWELIRETVLAQLTDLKMRMKRPLANNLQENALLKEFNLKPQSAVAMVQAYMAQLDPEEGSSEWDPSKVLVKDVKSGIKPIDLPKMNPFAQFRLMGNEWYSPFQLRLLAANMSSQIHEYLSPEQRLLQACRTGYSNRFSLAKHRINTKRQKPE